MLKDMVLESFRSIVSNPKLGHAQYSGFRAIERQEDFTDVEAHNQKLLNVVLGKALSTFVR